jgi:hypothetical protein
MHHPDLRHHARDRIVAAGEPGVIETWKSRRAAPGPTKRAPACASRRSPTLRRVPHEHVARTRASVMRPAGQAPEDAALYLCHCGHSFTAAVTTGVACPSCGTGQPW